MLVAELQQGSQFRICNRLYVVNRVMFAGNTAYIETQQGLIELPVDHYVEGK